MGLKKRHGAHAAERQDKQDDEKGNEPLSVGLAIDETRIGGVDEKPGMAGECRLAESIPVRYAPHCERRRPPRPRHAKPPQAIRAAASRISSFESSGFRLSTSNSRFASHCRGVCF